MHYRFTGFAAILLGAFLFAGPVSAANTTYSSSNWAGYVAKSSSYDGVGATWIVAEGDKNDDQSGHATWVGIGGFGKKDLIQSGTMALTDSDGYTVYMAWYEVLPKAAVPLRVPIKAGDSVTVSLTEEAQDEWKLTFTNNTTGKSVEKLLPYDSSQSSAEFIQEMITVGNGLRVPLDDFNDVSFTNSWVMQNGKKMNLIRANARPVTMIDRKKKKIATPEKIALSRDSFTISRTDIRATFTSVVQDSKAARKLKDNAELFDIEARKLKDGRFTAVKIMMPD